jgi:hypothetical protein
MLRGNGDGTFDTPITYRVPHEPELVRVSDLNGDAALDVVTLAQGMDLLGEAPTGATVLLNRGSGPLVGTLERMFDPARGLGPGDDNVPGGPLKGAHVRDRATPDLVVSRGGRTAVLLHQGDNRFANPLDVGTGAIVAAQDLDGDGLAELVLTCADTTHVWRSLGDGHFVLLGEYAGGTPVGLEDLDGDGRPDLGLVAADTQFVMRAGAADGTFGALQTLPVTFLAEALDSNQAVPKTSAVALADLDGDGLADVVAAVRKSAFAPNVDSVEVLFNLGAGQFTAPEWYDLPSPSPDDTAYPQRIGFGDLDGDGRKDVILLHTASDDHEGHLSMLMNAGARAFTRSAPLDDGNSPHELTVADMNHDGLSEILTVNSNGFATFHFFVYEDSGGVLRPFDRYRVADVATGLTVADLDADGRPDVVTYGPRWGGSLVIVYNRSTRPIADAPAASFKQRPGAVAFASLRPNPSRGRAAIAFTLPTAGAVSLEVLDIAGRRVRSRQLDGLAAGEHVVSLGAGEPALPPGVYLLRIGHDGKSSVSRFCVVN